MKRISFVLLATCIFVLAASGVAFANFGPHGGYTTDTDGCAGCHRAHTSFSTLGWKDTQGGDRASALLISDAANMTDFCYACHGDAAPGASTNVQMGIYDSGPSSGLGGGVASNPTGVPIFADTNSTYGSALNGGGFEEIGAAKPIMSAHDMPRGASGDPTFNAKVGPAIMWGSDTTKPLSSFRCTDCHDPHGTSNYRLLKADVNGATRGGYNSNGDPDAWVLSNEEGFPANGFKKGTGADTDVAGYVPNYTSPQYAATYTQRGMGAWCSGCHTGYNTTESSTDYGTYEGVRLADGSLDPMGPTARHRHIIDYPLESNTSSDPDERFLNVPLKDDPGLPLEMPRGQLAAGTDHKDAKIWDARGNLSCLTCHFAHGSASTMEGWAVAELAGTTANPAPMKLTPGDPDAVANQDNPLGVNPNFSQAILRYDNRGVCERCHDK